MTNKQIVSTAIEQLEKEKQEAEIKKIKGIVKAYLEKILDKKEQIKDLQAELKELETDLADLKVGRLDKIEERQTKDPAHKKYTLIIVKKVEDDYIPFQPWKSPWIVEYNQSYTPMIQFDSGVQRSIDGTFTNNTTTSDCCSMVAYGTTFQNFSGGTYTINGQTYSL